jgi:hypothetical protein
LESSFKLFNVVFWGRMGGGKKQTLQVAYCFGSLERHPKSLAGSATCFQTDDLPLHYTVLVKKKDL